MRVAVDCTHHLIPGGVKTYLDNLVPTITALAPDDEFVLYYRGRRRPTEFPGVIAADWKSVHAHLPQRLLTTLESRLGWPKAERWTGPIDVFHATHLCLPAVRSSTHCVLTVQDVTYLRHPEYFEHRDLNEFGYRKLLPRALARADVILAASDATRRDLIELCDVDESRIWVCRHGLDPRIERASHEKQYLMRQELGLGDRPVALYPIGTVDRRKNLAFLLRAFASAFPNRSERPLLLLSGVGELSDEHQTEIEKLKLTRDVQFATVSYPAGVATLMSFATWGVYPSLYEGFGFPVLEAMACGLPMVVTDRTSCPEIIGSCGLLADPTDESAWVEAMRRLDGDSGLRYHQSTRARERALSPLFGWHRAGRQVLASYAGDRHAFDAAAVEEVPRPQATR